jgi:hypothetical protein
MIQMAIICPIVLMCALQTQGNPFILEYVVVGLTKPTQMAMERQIAWTRVQQMPTNLMRAFAQGLNGLI